LEEALESRKPVAEITAIFSKYLTAVQNLQPLRAYEGRQTQDHTSSYRTLIQYLKDVESGLALVFKRNTEQARTAALQIGGEKGARLEQLIIKLDAEMAEQDKKRAAAGIEKLRKKIAAAKDANDVDAILGELRDSKSDLSRGAEKNGGMPIIPPLSTISNAWRLGNPLLFQNFDNIFSSSVADFEPEVSGLRTRAMRDIAARILRAPELNQTPLAEKSLPEAIETLCEQLAAAREWRRLLQVLEGRAGIAFTDGRQPTGRGGDDSLTAIRAYFVAQNFELAEMWAEAAESYRSVLRSTSQRVPITEAAERLKKLVKEHPEANRSPEPAAVTKGQ
jgi:hypothetical protein